MIAHSILDNDLYKFSMMQAFLHQFPGAVAEYKLVLRNFKDHTFFLKNLPRIMDEIAHLENLKLTGEEYEYLTTIRFFKRDFIDFLRLFRFNMGYVSIREVDNSFEIRISGPIIHVILYEIPILYILSEIYSEESTSDEDMADMIVNQELEWFAVTENGAKVADFGTRRRHSFRYQEAHLKMAKRFHSCVGTSNVKLAMQLGLRPIGTMAHEWIMAGQGLGPRIANSQKFMLQKWADEYRGDLGIALTDTITMDAFIEDFDLYFTKLFDGCRHDSGNPIKWGEKLIRHYESLRINPLTKSAVFSDGLSMHDVVWLNETFRNRLNTSFGVGTQLTNPFKPLNAVIKLVKVNGNPVAKISDEPGKTVCEDEEYLGYLRKVFNVG